MSMAGKRSGDVQIATYQGQDLMSKNQKNGQPQSSKTNNQGGVQGGFCGNVTANLTNLAFTSFHFA